MEKKRSTASEFEREREREKKRERTKNVNYNDHTIRLLTISLSRIKRTIIGRSQKRSRFFCLFIKGWKRNKKPPVHLLRFSKPSTEERERENISLIFCKKRLSAGQTHARRFRKKQKR